MENLLLPAATRFGRQLEHHPAAKSDIARKVAAADGRAVEITGGIEDQARGKRSVAALAEVIQHLLRPPSTRFGRQLERRARLVKAAASCRAVEIAGGIEDQPA